MQGVVFWGPRFRPRSTLVPQALKAENMFNQAATDSVQRASRNILLNSWNKTLRQINHSDFWPGFWAVYSTARPQGKKTQNKFPCFFYHLKPFKTKKKKLLQAPNKPASLRIKHHGKARAKMHGQKSLDRRREPRWEDDMLPANNAFLKREHTP